MHSTLQKNAYFLGRQPRYKVLEHFTIAQFSVVSCLAEVFSVKILVIGSDTGAIAEIIEDVKSGLSFPIGDYKALTLKIRLLLSNYVL